VPAADGAAPGVCDGLDAGIGAGVGLDAGVAAGVGAGVGVPVFCELVVVLSLLSLLCDTGAAAVGAVAPDSGAGVPLGAAEALTCIGKSDCSTALCCSPAAMG